MPKSGCKALLNELLRDISVLTIKSRETSLWDSDIDLRVTAAVSDSSTFSLVKLAFLGTDEVDMDFHSLSDELLA